MNNLTIEQMREIVDGAPDGATHVEIIEDEASEYWLLDSETNLWHWHKDPSDPNRAWRIGIPELTVENIYSIENLRTIIAQHEEIERLREENDRLKSDYGDNWYDGFMAAREWHLNENTCDLSDLDGSDVISLSENAEQIKAKGESDEC